MSYHKKLQQFFKDKGLTQVEISRRVPYSQVMISRYLSKNAPNLEFIKNIEKAFPDIDWNYLFKDNASFVEEPSDSYLKSPEKLLEEIQINVNLLKDWHDSDTEEK